MAKIIAYLFFFTLSVVSYGDSFSRDDSKEVVIDVQHQLMWQDTARNKRDNKIASEDYSSYADDLFNRTNSAPISVAVEYCESLSHAGFDDWRLPKRMELLYIADRTRLLPAINQSFKNVSSERYWSSSVRVKNDGNYFWVVNFDNGGATFDFFSSATLVRCVRNMK